MDKKVSIRESLVALLNQTIAERKLTTRQVSEAYEVNLRLVNHWRKGNHFNCDKIEELIKKMGVTPYLMAQDTVVELEVGEKPCEHCGEYCWDSEPCKKMRAS
jgi:predicted XRE-type DNA-binding protein